MRSIFILALLSTSLLAVEQEKPLQEQDVSKRIAALGSESFDTRTEASRKLVALGESGIPLLKKHLEEANDPETKSGIERVIARITLPKAIVATPIAYATTKSLIRLDGRPSVAPPDSPLEFKWTQIEGVNLEVPVGELQKPQWGLRIKTPGTFKFQLVVTANGKKSTPATMEIIVASTEDELAEIKKGREAGKEERK